MTTVAAFFLICWSHSPIASSANAYFHSVSFQCAVMLAWGQVHRLTGKFFFYSVTSRMYLVVYRRLSVSSPSQGEYFFLWSPSTNVSPCFTPREHAHRQVKRLYKLTNSISLLNSAQIAHWLLPHHRSTQGFPPPASPPPTAHFQRTPLPPSLWYVIFNTTCFQTFVFHISCQCTIIGRSGRQGEYL